MSQKHELILTAAIESTRETAIESLGCSTGRSFFLGLASSESACRGLAHSLLGFGPEEEELVKEDLVDAFGEIVNIIAGLLQRKLVGHMARLKLGLPMVVDGRITGRFDTTQITVRFDGIPADILLLSKPRPKSG